jgi:transposase-like protein
MTKPNRLNNQPNGSRPVPVGAPDPEVQPQATRRKFSAAYKRRIVTEADACQEPGGIGALLRREGLYSSHLTTWRRQMAEGTLNGQGKYSPNSLTAENARLRQENEGLRRELEKAQLIMDAQKKLSQVLTLMASDEAPGSERA